MTNFDFLKSDKRFVLVAGAASTEGKIIHSYTI